MDPICHTVTLYTAQTPAVKERLLREGTCFSRAEYVRRKYGESAPVFLTVYEWFVNEAARRVPLPEGAEFPYWAFFDCRSADTSSGDVELLQMDVPLSEGIYFDMYDWTTLLRLDYLGETEAETLAFRRELTQRGLRSTDVMLTNFHPALKQEILRSWQRLFRHHEAVLRGDLSGIGSVQAGLWQLKKAWLR